MMVGRTLLDRMHTKKLCCVDWVLHSSESIMIKFDGEDDPAA